jgi:flagellar motor switch protein FliN
MNNEEKMEEQEAPIENTKNTTTPPAEQELAENNALDEHVARPVEAVYDVPVVISAVLGSTKMPVSDLLKLTRGSILELERRVGDPIDIYVNNRLIAKGEVVSVDDKLAITMTDVIKILK